MMACGFHSSIHDGTASAIPAVEATTVPCSRVLDTLDKAARMRGMTRSAFVQKAATREILDPA